MSQVPGLVFLEKVRLSFPKVARAVASEQGGVPKFSAAFLMEPNHPGYAAFHAQVTAMATEKWGPQGPAILQFIQQDKRLRCFGRGEESINQETMLPYDGYQGVVVINANNEAQPALYGADGNPLMNASALYGGCYVNAQVKPWLQDNKHGRGVRCELVGIQFHSDGQAFGVAPIDPSTLFGAVAGAPPAMSQPGVGAPGQYAPAGYPPQGQPPAGYPPQGQYTPPVQPGYAPPPTGYAPPGQPPAQAMPWDAPPAQPAQQPRFDPLTGQPL